MLRHRMKFLATMVALLAASGTVALSPATATATAAEPFCDVSATDYYRDAVTWAKNVGITSGMTETIFDPDGSTTRAQLMTLLHRHVSWRDGVTPAAATAHTFTDVPPGAFFENAVEWAVATGLTTGVDPDHFAPDVPTTRAELAVFLHRLSPDAVDGGSAPFGDVARADWFHDAVAWMAATGLTTGTAPGVYNPSATASRAQIITFLWRASDSPAPGPHLGPRCAATWTAIGDSVMAGAASDTLLHGGTFPGWLGHVDAGPCRTALIRTRWPPCGPDDVPSTLEVVAGLEAAGTLGEVLILHAGTNGDLDAVAIDQLIEAAPTARTIWFITIRGSWLSNQTIENQAIADAVVRWDGRRDVRILDWHGLATIHEGWISDDGVHLSDSGRYGFVDMMAGAIAQS